MIFSKSKDTEALQSRVTELEGLLATSGTTLASITAERDNFSTLLTAAQGELVAVKAAHATELTQLKEAHSTALTTATADFEGRVKTEATEQLALLGVPADKLPKAAKGAAGSPEADLESTITDMQAETDPVAKGKLAAKASDLRAKLAAVGSN